MPCDRCGEPGDLGADGMCPRCTLRTRVAALLAGPGGAVLPPLVPVAEALAGADNPYRVLDWLRRSPAARLLGSLAADADCLDHSRLDRMPGSAATSYVRGLLVSAGVLPERNENLALLLAWLARTVARLPAHQATVIRPFAEWHVVRDARRRAGRGRYTYTAYKADAGNIHAAVQLLEWLDVQHLTLATVDQSHLDRWQPDRTTLRSRCIPFLRWATARHLAAEVTINHPASALPSTFQSEARHRQELHRCLHDDTLPREVRIVGALVRLYGLSLTRIVALTAAQYSRQGPNAYLAVNQHPVLLPPRLAALIEQQFAENPATVPDGGAGFLLPGVNPGRSRNASGLASTMSHHGLPVRAARNTAMLESVADLPPIIIADMFGLSPQTANRWARIAGESWSAFLAAVDAAPQHRGAQTR